jgi:predicted Co/Zn/Cd cation transporter (cation efflux family)
MTRVELKQLILEAAKKAVEKRKKHRSSSSYITSTSDEKINLYINVSIEASDMKEAEKLREDITNTLQKEYNIKKQKTD